MEIINFVFDDLAVGYCNETQQVNILATVVVIQDVAPHEQMGTRLNVHRGILAGFSGKVSIGNVKTDNVPVGAVGHAEGLVTAITLNPRLPLIDSLNGDGAC